MIRNASDGCCRRACPTLVFAPSPLFLRRFRRVILLVWLFFGFTRVCPGYSLLTHEQVVDILWKDEIVPLVLKRYPGATEEQLKRAHAYAYGGCLIQDVGYYPFGNKFFSDLVHYVRTGDFVTSLIEQSANLDEYSFALGALAHYSSDNNGHPLVNHAVALTFPKLHAKFGETVTYEQSPKAHVQTEFGFDITQVAKGRYTSDRYHDFIGFAISRPLLERAFFKTYGLRLEEVLNHVDLAIGTFRRAVSQVIPEMVRAALTAYHPEIVRETPDFSEKRFLYNVSRAQYEKEWGKQYRKPGFLERVLGFIVRLIPKIGFLKSLAFKIPTPQTEDLYFQSVNNTVASYRTLLRKVGKGDTQFQNLNCDTGREVHLGEYKSSDETYARLLEILVKRGLEDVQPELRANILTFYADTNALNNLVKPPKGWQRTQDELGALKAGPNSAAEARIRKRLIKPHLRLQSPKAHGAV